jgi:hypothetical protein
MSANTRQETAVARRGTQRGRRRDQHCLLLLTRTLYQFPHCMLSRTPPALREELVELQRELGAWKVVGEKVLVPGTV